MLFCQWSFFLCFLPWRGSEGDSEKRCDTAFTPERPRNNWTRRRRGAFKQEREGRERGKTVRRKSYKKNQQPCSTALVASFLQYSTVPLQWALFSFPLAASTVFPFYCSKPPFLRTTVLSRLCYHVTGILYCSSILYYIQWKKGLSCKSSCPGRWWRDSRSGLFRKGGERRKAPGLSLRGRIVDWKGEKRSFFRMHIWLLPPSPSLSSPFPFMLPAVRASTKVHGALSPSLPTSNSCSLQ